MLEAVKNNPVICPANEFKGKGNFWITTDGTAYIVGDFGHLPWAIEFMDANVDKLEDLGWIHFSHYNAWCFPRRLTSKQTSVLLDICIANSLKYTDIIRDVSPYRREEANV